MKIKYQLSLRSALVAMAAASMLFSGCIDSPSPKEPAADEERSEMSESPPKADGNSPDGGAVAQPDPANTGPDSPDAQVPTPMDEPGEEPADEPTDEPAEEPVAEPMEEPMEEPSDEPLTAQEICDRMAAEVVRCLEPTCPSVTQVPTLVEAGLSAGCVKSAERDDAPPPEFIDQLDEQGCAHPVIRAVVQELTDAEGRGGRPGRLHGLCSDGLRVPLNTCKHACMTLRECTPEDSEEGGPLRDTETCMYLCTISDDAFAPAAWECFGEADACSDIQGCAGRR